MDLTQYQGILVFGLGLITTIALWMLRAHILQVVNEKTSGAAQTSALRVLDDRLDAHDARLGSIETALRHLPTADQMSALNLLVADLRGEVRALHATVAGVEKIVNSTGRRLELIDEHLKRGA